MRELAIETELQEEEEARARVEKSTERRPI
jgi:hypothetical protein